MAKFSIDENIIKETKCGFNFECLDSGKCPEKQCNPSDVINDKMIWVKNIKKDGCPHYESFRGGHICCCPTRYEIFRKYGV